MRYSKWTTMFLCLGALSVSCKKKMPDAPSNPEMHKFVSDEMGTRYTLVGSIGAQYTPEDIVARIVYQKKVNGKCPDAPLKTIESVQLGGTQFLKDKAELVAQPMSNKWFEAREKLEGNAGALFPLFGIKTDGAYAAEWIMTDTTKVSGFKQVAATKVAALAKQELSDDYCGRYLITDVFVTHMHYKKYTSGTSTYDIAGTGFSIGGGFAASNEIFQLKPFISVDVLNVDVIAAEAGGTKSPLEQAAEALSTNPADPDLNQIVDADLRIDMLRSMKSTTVRDAFLGVDAGGSGLKSMADLPPIYVAEVPVEFIDDALTVKR